MKVAVSEGLQRASAKGAESALRGGIDQLVRRNLRGVWVRGELPAGPAVWAGNHHSWWDFFVAAAALRTAGRTDVGVLMEADNRGNPRLFRQVTVGANQLRTASSMIAAGMTLVVFPEGELRPPGPLGPVQPGARWLADRNGAELRSVATRVVLRGQQAPEAYLDVSAPLPAELDLGTVLGDQLAGLDAELAASDPELPLFGFEQLVTGVRSWNERFKALRGSR